MYLHLSGGNKGFLFYSDKGWFPNTPIEFYTQGHSVRARTKKKIPERILRHAIAIFKKHFLK